MCKKVMENGSGCCWVFDKEENKKKNLPVMLILDEISRLIERKISSATASVDGGASCTGRARVSRPLSSCGPWERRFQGLMPCIKSISFSPYCEHGAEHGKRNSQAKLSNLTTLIIRANASDRCNVFCGLGGFRGQPDIFSFSFWFSARLS